MRILIADDHALFRDGLRSLLEAHGFDVAGEARDGAEAVEKAWSLKPDVVLMDLTMPGANGLDATKRLAAELPEMKVVILTASDDDDLLFEAVKCGAKGYLLKDLDSESFCTLLERVSQGEPVFTPTLARKLLHEFAKPRRAQRDSGDAEALTRRETEVLELMVSGATSNRRLARKLGLSENTIKFHVRNILDKLHLHNRAEVVAYALRHHIVEPREDR